MALVYCYQSCYRITMLQRSIYISIFALLLLGGIFGQNLWFIWISTVILAFFVLLLAKKPNNFDLPKTFKTYFLFLIIFLASLFWSKDFLISLRTFMLFLSGGFIYLIFFNLIPKKKGEFFYLLVFSLGLFFGSVLIFKQLNHSLQVDTGGGLMGLAGGYKNHHHIGDLWSVILLMAVYKIFNGAKNKALFWILAFIPGVYFLEFSRSRSGLFSLLAGLIYLFSSQAAGKKQKVLTYLLLTVILILFLLFASEKSLLFSRIYYIESIIGFFKFPLGVGVGNFGFISNVVGSWFSIASAYSSVTHNIILEFLTGMGVFAVTFIYWLWKEVKFIFFGSVGGPISVYSLVFVILLVNFLFDYTYFIPTFLWMFFISLGFVHKKN